MLKELQKLLPSIPALIDDPNRGWQSLLIDKYPPVIHRLFLRLTDDRTLLLHRLFNTHDTHALMHSHSWPFACKVLSGEYEMGVGFSKDRNAPPASTFTTTIKAGDLYEILSPDIWHFTKPTKATACTHSVLLIGQRCRARKAENTLPLSSDQQTDVFTWFRENLGEG